MFICYKMSSWRPQVHPLDGCTNRREKYPAKFLDDGSPSLVLTKASDSQRLSLLCRVPSWKEGVPFLSSISQHPYRLRVRGNREVEETCLKAHRESEAGNRVSQAHIPRGHCRLLYRQRSRWVQVREQQNPFCYFYNVHRQPVLRRRIHFPKRFN